MRYGCGFEMRTRREGRKGWIGLPHAVAVLLLVVLLASEEELRELDGQREATRGERGGRKGRRTMCGSGACVS